MLSNGQEVRLQRNALSVIQHPTGLEEDSDIDGEGLGNGNGTGGPGPNSTNGAQGEKKGARLPGIRIRLVSFPNLYKWPM